MAIILLTLVGENCFVPFTLSQIRSTEGIKDPTGTPKIQTKYKNNPEEQQRRIMELYQK